MFEMELDVAPLLHVYVYAGMPPETVKVMAPFEPPAQPT